MDYSWCGRSDCGRAFSNWNALPSIHKYSGMEEDATTRACVSDSRATIS